MIGFSFDEVISVSINYDVSYQVELKMIQKIRFK